MRRNIASTCAPSVRSTDSGIARAATSARRGKPYAKKKPAATAQIASAASAMRQRRSRRSTRASTR
ncbi:hypothetical protein [Tahibacter soli]|uniref:Uncharacterized protein n=1 Tax=Tahibacter soli TaxID=2983605 RepID=A0A9X3YFP4_9GAMM|nr:hypothetical protein [Tahibacter soli]MDC8011109.1 hypothetical protein [Tahibacter soli]